MRSSFSSPADYLIFRIYEAASQLLPGTANKIAVCVLEEYEFSFSRLFKERTIDWQNPKFLRFDFEMESLLKEKFNEKKNPEKEISEVISTLNELWFFRYSSAFNLERVHKVFVS